MTVSFTLDDAELARVQDQFAKPQARTGLSLVAITFVAGCNVFSGVLGIVRHHEISAVVGCFQILCAIVYVPLLRNSLLTTLLSVEPGHDIEICIDDAGLTLSQPSKRIPWKRIKKIRDVGEAFVAVRMFGRSIPILKRALPDGGTALWTELEVRLTASRYLIRGTDSRLSIFNSATRC